MADEKKKGFDLGKSGDSAPGFDLNKESAAPAEQSKGFNLGKGDEPAPSTFDLGKGQEAAAAAPKVAETTAKESAQAKEKSKEAGASKSKAPSNEKATPSAKTIEKGKETGKQIASPVKTAKGTKATVKSQPKAESPKASSTASKTSSASATASKKRSNAPILIAIILLVAVGLFMFIPSGGDSDSELAPTFESQSNVTDETQAGELPNAITTEDSQDSERAGTVASEGSNLDGNESAADMDVDDNALSSSTSASDNSISSKDENYSSAEESTSTEVQSSSASGEASSVGAASSMSDVSSETADSDEAVKEESLNGSSSMGITTTSNDTPLSASSSSSSSASAGLITFSQNSTQAQIPSSLINQIKSHLAEGSANRVLIEGHSSSEGDKFYNIGLSRRRAEAVKSQLVKAGVDESKVEVQAKGSDYPVASNETVSGRKKNRRVEVKLD